MSLFYLVPIGILLVHAFWSVEYPSIDHTLTLVNFETFFTRDVYARILLRTVLMALAVTVTDIVLAFPLAFWIAKRVKGNRELLLFLVIFPLWSSYLIRIFAWKTLLGTSGIINSFLIWTGLIDDPVSFFLYSKWSIFLALTHVWLPFMVLPLFTVLDRIPDSLLEASADLGAGWFSTFRTVILPLSRPGLLAGSLATFSLTMGDYIAPTLLGGPGDQMIGKIVADQFGVADNWPLGAMLIIPVLVMISVLLIVSNRVGAMERSAA
jgi:spermidine/putrescine transport system permease protein